MNILVIDDEKMVSEVIADFLSLQLGHSVTVCSSAIEAEALYKRELFPLIISDICMPQLTGMDVVKAVKKQWGNRSSIVLITGHAKLETALQALRLGARDYLPKPIDVTRLAEIADAIEAEMQQASSPDDKPHLPARHQRIVTLPQIGTVSFSSTVMIENVELALKLHKDRAIPVILEGETGTGKEIFARLIHYGEAEEKRPFISINCSAISPHLFESELFGYAPGSFTGAHRKGKPGKLELARGGTIFLDEIGDMPAEMQPKLLKAIEEKMIYRVGGVQPVPLDVRIIAASNKNLAQLAADGLFRSDLLYRINTSKITLPPLRERRSDILELARLFAQRYALTKREPMRRITPEAELFLHSYPWPGNIRQLRNAIERAMLMYESPEIRPEFFAFLHRESAETQPAALDWVFTVSLPKTAMSLYEIEETLCRKVLQLLEGNKTQTARYLGISNNKLRRILKEM
jgi:DNA-binding NtrC family response regulator